MTRIPKIGQTSGANAQYTGTQNNSALSLKSPILGSALPVTPASSIDSHRSIRMDINDFTEQEDCIDINLIDVNGLIDVNDSLEELHIDLLEFSKEFLGQMCNLHLFIAYLNGELNEKFEFPFLPALESCAKNIGRDIELKIEEEELKFKSSNPMLENNVMMVSEGAKKYYRRNGCDREDYYFKYTLKADPEFINLGYLVEIANTDLENLNKIKNIIDEVINKNKEKLESKIKKDIATSGFYLIMQAFFGLGLALSGLVAVALFPQLVFLSADITLIVAGIFIFFLRLWRGIERLLCTEDNETKTLMEVGIKVINERPAKIFKLLKQQNKIVKEFDQRYVNCRANFNSYRAIQRINKNICEVIKNSEGQAQRIDKDFQEVSKQLSELKAHIYANRTYSQSVHPAAASNNPQRTQQSARFNNLQPMYQIAPYNRRQQPEQFNPPLAQQLEQSNPPLAQQPESFPLPLAQQLALFPPHFGLQQGPLLQHFALPSGPFLQHFALPSVPLPPYFAPPQPVALSNPQYEIHMESDSIRHEIQIGRGNTRHAIQIGPDNTQIVTQIGKNNKQHVTQEGGNSTQHATQKGGNNTLCATQEGENSTQHAIQTGNDNAQHATQRGRHNTQHAFQKGIDNEQHATQVGEDNAQNATQDGENNEQYAIQKKSSPSQPMTQAWPSISQLERPLRTPSPQPLAQTESPTFRHVNVNFA